MLGRIKQVLNPPTFEGDMERERLAHKLHSIMLVIFIGVTIMILASPLITPERRERLIFIIPLFPVIGLLFILNRQGHVRLAGFLLIAGLWGITTAATMTGGGIRTAASLTYMIIVLTTALLFGTRTAVFVAVGSSLTTLGLVYLENQGGLSSMSLPNSPLFVWFMQTLMLALALGLFDLAVRDIRQALANARKELVERQRAEEREQRRSELLEKIIGLGKSVTEVTDFQTTLLRIWDGVRNGLDFDRIGLFLYDSQDNTMQGAYGTDRTGQLIEAWDVKFELDPQGLFFDVLNRPNGVYFTQDLERVRNLQPDHDMFGVKHYAAIGVWAGDKPVAIIAVDQLITGRSINEEQLEALRLFAGYAGLAIENARLNTELEQRVGERTTQLESANNDLESFTYSVSHDLRGPLRAINGFSALLQQQYVGLLDEIGQQFIFQIQKNAERMNQLINDLLTFARLGRQPIHKETVEPAALVREVWEELQLDLNRRQVNLFIAEELPPCDADPSLLQQVFVNLLGNAFKYSRTRDIARIDVGWQEQDGKIVYFVRDNGVGFDMRYSDKLFGVFQRLHRQDEFEGTGVGLAIVHRIVERHGGRIWGESQLNEGATFYFTL
jgi:signal transduction histidine kinase